VLQCFKSQFAQAVAALLLLLKSTEHTPSLSDWLRLLSSLTGCQRWLHAVAVRDCSRTLVNDRNRIVLFPQSAFPAVGVTFFGRSDSFDLGSCEIRNQPADFRDHGYPIGTLRTGSKEIAAPASIKNFMPVFTQCTK